MEHGPYNMLQRMPSVALTLPMLPYILGVRIPNSISLLREYKLSYLILLTLNFSRLLNIDTKSALL